MKQQAVLRCKASAEDPWLSLALATLSALVVVTCSAMGPLEVPPPRFPAATPAPDRRTEQGSGSDKERSAVGGSAESPAALPGHGFPHLASAFRGLGAGGGAPVRIAWFGDSHTAADYLTDAVRVRLQERFGNGGPGFVRLGTPGYRHGRVAVERKGRWRREPRSPASVEREADGVFGLGGMRAAPESRDAEARIQLRATSVRGDARWELMYRTPNAGSSFHVAIDGNPPQPTSGEPLGSSGLLRMVRQGRAAGSIAVTSMGGTPELLGAYVESTEPGVVLDAFGIDGARVRTPLAWDEAAFVDELGARKPALVVLAYGTNEAFGGDSLSALPSYWRGLSERLRKAAPGADCLIVGPTDAPEQDGSSKPRILQVDALERSLAPELGCTYFSMVDAMGGPGGFDQWRQQDPPLSAADGVHLTVDGYVRIGEAVAELLLSATSLPH